VLARCGLDPVGVERCGKRGTRFQAAYGPKEAKRGISESQIVELADGRILLTGRGWNGELYRKKSVSADGGQSWSRLVEICLGRGPRFVDGFFISRGSPLPN
jgi:hypothetical protein